MNQNAMGAAIRPRADWKVWLSVAGIGLLVILLHTQDRGVKFEIKRVAIPVNHNRDRAEQRLMLDRNTPPAGFGKCSQLMPL